MKLRTHVNLIVGCLSAAFMVLVLWLQLDSARRAVDEEMAAAGVVASQVLGRVAQVYQGAGHAPLLSFLDDLGRVRANEITLTDADGRVLYRSPPSPYKAGREAPDWFAQWFVPSPLAHVFTLGDGYRLRVEPNASRAILDSWDNIRGVILTGLIGFAILNGLVFWLVGRAIAPWTQVVRGLSSLEQGALNYRVPALQGYEAQFMASAFNRMADAVQERFELKRKARDAEAQLQERRELDALIEQRLEEERRAIARELHDEFAQSVTAIRSLAVVIAQKADASSAEAAHLISAEASRLYDSMHGLIPRLAPPSLDTLGLADTLEGFIRDWQRRHPDITFDFRCQLAVEPGASLSLAIYRIVQEGVINAVRHAHAERIDVSLACEVERLRVSVVDDGVGLNLQEPPPGRFGLRGLHERVEKLRGEFRVRNRQPHGVELLAVLPLQPLEVTS